jgi:hypothetical protein
MKAGAAVFPFRQNYLIVQQAANKCLKTSEAVTAAEKAI